MLILKHLVFLFLLCSVLAKTTYFNLDNIYGPYCNAHNTYTPDAALVRYAGIPWGGKCELNLESCCLPVLNNSTVMANLSISTRFFIRLLKPPLCSTETVVIQAETGEAITIHCNATEGSEYYLNTERLTVIYYREAKWPTSKFAMVVTPLKMKTRMYSLCGFDCFTDTHCIDRSLVCDRSQNCPNNVDEARCEYNNQRPPLSSQSKIILLIVLLMIISFDISSILICYFCCGISNSNRVDPRERKSNPGLMEEGGANRMPLLQSTISKNTNQSN